MVSNGLSAVSAADMSLKASVSAPPAAKSYKCLSNSILHRVLPLPISPLETKRKIPSLKMQHGKDVRNMIRKGLLQGYFILKSMVNWSLHTYYYLRETESVQSII